MNWKKILFYTFAGGFAGSLGHYASEVQQGHHIAFTFGTIVAPALGGILAALSGLFVKPPNQP